MRMQEKYRGVIALDLDGTLLNSEKQITDTNRRALEKAHEAGFAIVPTTGRFYGGMPRQIRDLPFLRYAITINGAMVEDLATGEVIYRAEIPLARALAICEAMDGEAVLYDCYRGNEAFMSAHHKARIDEMLHNPHYKELIHRLRKPVEDLKAFIRGEGCDVQKIQLFMPDAALRRRLMEQLPLMFEGLAVSSSISENIEINDARAHKGAALLALAAHLGLRREDTYAFGDGLNDLSMLREAGLGIAMANAEPEAKAAADLITRSCDEDGVAYAITRLLQTI